MTINDDESLRANFINNTRRRIHQNDAADRERRESYYFEKSKGILHFSVCTRK